jgi:hypothetical protein
VVEGPGGVQDDVPLLLDSGADVSVIPLSVARALGATVEPAWVQIRYFRGEDTTYDRATLSVEFGGYRFKGPFLVADADYGVLGRNVLNLLVLTLDGPTLTWSS